MIKSLKIHNVQSHEDTALVFSDGINVIIGASDQGKSAILRALYWVKYNRPLGIDTLASHWIVNDKGNLKGAMSVVLENENGVVERRRTADDNQYIVNGEVLNVVKTDVPTQVEEVLRLSDTNVQRQLDAPFLLSNTSGEVAKYFNRIVNLDVIDKVLTNAESKRRKNKNDIEYIKTDIESLQNKLEQYKWVDEVAPLIEECSKIRKQYDELDSSYRELTALIESYESCIQKREYYAQYDSASDLILKIDRCVESLDEQEHDTHQLNLDIMRYENNESSVYDFSIQNELCQRIESLEATKVDRDGSIMVLSEDIDLYEMQTVFNLDEAKLICDRIDSLSSSTIANDVETLCDNILRYRGKLESIQDLNSKIEELKNQLPELCPLCGQPIRDYRVLHL